MIQIQNLQFSYGRNTVLRNISMSLEDGHIYGLLGENGVGKTTLLTLLAGLKKPELGTISVEGENPFKRRPSCLQDQYFLPDEVLPLNMSASAFASAAGKFWPNFRMETFLTVMNELETDPVQKMNSMSAGQLKKTYVSFALATGVKHLYMDEPTNGLDIPSKAQFRKAVTRYTREDAVIVISTHQVRDLENLIDPIIILDRQSVLLNASLERISEKLYFDYSNTLHPEALYTEQLPGGFIQVYPNTTGEETKVNIEALFNAVRNHKETIKQLYHE